MTVAAAFRRMGARVRPGGLVAGQVTGAFPATGHIWICFPVDIMRRCRWIRLWITLGISYAPIPCGRGKVRLQLERCEGLLSLRGGERAEHVSRETLSGRFAARPRDGLAENTKVLSPIRLLDAPQSRPPLLGCWHGPRHAEGASPCAEVLGHNSVSLPEL